MVSSENIKARFFNFLVLCIPARLCLVVLAKYLPLRLLPLFSIPFFVMAAGFLYLNFFEKRMTGIETGGEAIWWHPIRPIHGFLMLLFALLAISKIRESWIVLLIDTLFGLTAFFVYHITNNNIKKLF